VAARAKRGKGRDQLTASGPRRGPKPRWKRSAESSKPCRRLRRRSTRASFECLVGLHLNTVRSHLRVLVQAGLVSARREQCTRPGRPRVLYEAAAEPPDARALTSYRLLAQILASSLGSERDPSARAEEAGQAWGAHLVQRPPPFTSISEEDTIDEVVRLHEQYGFRPELRQARAGRSSCCPFQELATSYQAVVYSLHLGLIRGALAELAIGVEADSLEPFTEPGACVSHLTRSSRAPKARRQASGRAGVLAAGQLPGVYSSRGRSERRAVLRRPRAQDSTSSS
jgi:predicted ArsR family transcriptional regulator